jgi:CBS domain containing-hemolysin-like protein
LSAWQFQNGFNLGFYAYGCLIQILAQAVCTRYGLTVGAAMVPLVRVLLLLFFPISYPVSKLRQIPDSEYTIRTSFLASELYSVQVDLATDNLAWI